MAKSKHYYIRRTHRYLGLLLGIQFLAWTIGGLYFSWTNIDDVHGDFQHRHVPMLAGNKNFISPDSVLKKLPATADSIQAIQLVNILQQPHYSIAYFIKGQPATILAHAETGVIRNPINKADAVSIASASFNGNPDVQSVEYITNTTGHHEYREKPLPAWAISFNHPTNTTVYVSANFGRVESFRNNKWRLFDFLWMMHTMDYKQRDNFNNWLLRAFSVFGLVTILSGFLLFWVSRKKKKKKVEFFQLQ